MTRKFSIDPARCRTCGSAPDGLQCEQPITIGYERQLVRTQTQLSVHCSSATGPCTDLCPLSLCIQGYSKHIAAGEYAEALGHIMARVVLPESVCRVCDRPCETVCVRSGLDEAVAINDLKRFVVQWAAEQEHFPYQPPQEPRHDRRVAVVGAGPSGLSAGYDLALRGYTVAIYDSAERAGGLLAHGIPAYRLPKDALERDIARIASVGVDFILNSMLGRDITVAGLLEDHDAVYLAIGAHQSRALPLETAQGAPPVEYALRFLETRETPAGDIVVIGGGDAAIDAARTALRNGARTVTLACLESRETMPALPDQVTAALEEGVELRTKVRPVRLLKGAIALEELQGETPFTLEADLVIAAIGQLPDLSAVGSGVRVEDGHVHAETTTRRCAEELVFAGGDVAGGEGTVTGAIADGLRAAWAIDQALRGDAANIRRPPRIPSAPPATIVPSAPLAARRRPPELGSETRLGGGEVRGKLSEADARAEAARCFVCGSCANCRACLDLFGCPAIGEHQIGGERRISIDVSLCNGCGVCATLCPNGAITPDDEPDGEPQ